MKNTGNLWQTTDRPALTSPPLAEDRTTDLAVIGGGFTGCSAALEAARRGASVTLLEAETMGFGGSGRNVGLVNAGLWLAPADVTAQMGAAPARRLLDALAAAPVRVWALINREMIACDATQNGTLHLAHSPMGLRNLESRYRQARELGWPVKLLDADETQRRTGSSAFHGALFDPRAGTIQPLLYVRGLAAAAVAAGARLHENTCTSRISRQNGCWLIEANGHTVRAQNLLLATNAYFDGIDMGFRPETVSVSYFQFATRPLRESERAGILTNGEGCWDTAKIMSSFRTDHAGRMIIGGVGDLDGPGRRIHTGWARRKLSAIYPQLADIPFEYQWCGRIAMTRDHIPKIVAFGKNALACFGYSGRGIGPGTVFGAQSAIALLDGDDSALPVAPVTAHLEPAVTLRQIYYETGAILTHAVYPSPFVGRGARQK